MKLPVFLKKYFWDVKFEELDDKKHNRYIIERILGYGGMEASIWMTERYSRKKIIGIVKDVRYLPKQSMNFWCLVFDIPKSQLRSRLWVNKLWPY